MKKLIYLAPVALAAMMTACAGSGQKEAAEGTATETEITVAETPDADTMTEVTDTVVAEPEAEAPVAETKEQPAPANKKVTLPSGLGIEVLKAANGPKPSETSTVSVTYTGSLTDGTVFDSTDTPIEFNLMQVIPGFREGISNMNQGSTCRLYIPAAMGYGRQGVPGVIPANADLIFDVTLVSFK
ncbi:MAG: FKBP-type peptidyl-prolyl cis-trans isomerase [Muribaculaceae bacterium]|nr:FKBP-type peptidyl-prolyl cis-trans isomerase [Muribaculaceae bacterium]